MKRVAIATLGCKTNQFESAAMIEQFEQGGYRIVPFTQPADIYVVNSCTVTARTDAETRRLIRRARRLNPEARIIATGCYAQVAPGELEQMPEVDSVLGNREKQDIFGFAESGESRVSDISSEVTVGPLKLESFAEHTRAFLQAQNGCNSFCAYCIVPYARGRSRSVPLEDVLQGVRNLAANGYREVVLTGIHLGAYGLDLHPAQSLTGLVQRINAEQLVSRLRIGSVEPNELTDELLALMAKSEIVCPHLHLPLQSGSAAVLQGMGRKYSPEFFRRLVERLTQEVPDISIGLDLIAGFPGESSASHQETVTLLTALPLAYLHVFPYSSRPGTKAAALPGHLDPGVIKRRAEELRRLGVQKSIEFAGRFVGRELPVLVQGSGVSGISRNYLTVRLDGPAACPGTEHAVKITSVTSDGSCRGELPG